MKKRTTRTRPARAPRASSAPSAPTADHPEFDQAYLQTQTYLTVREAMAYLRGFPSEHAFRVWATRRGIPKYRAAGLRFRRMDLDRTMRRDS